MKFIILFTFLSYSSLFAQEFDVQKLSNYWVLTKVKAQGSSEYQPSNNEDPYGELILLSTGSFIRPYNNQYTAGLWKLEDSYIGFSITEMNGRYWSSSDYDFSWKIISVSNKELILRSGGDHGFYYYVYNPKNQIQ
jgi:hypothetical protein